MSQVVPWKAFLYKIRRYFSTFVLTRGLLIALFSSAFIYLDHWGLSHPILNTFLGLLSLYLLLQSSTKVWFISGFFIGLFWFWWIALSLIHYEMVWAAPIEIVIIMLSYGAIFAFISWVSEKLSSLLVGCCVPTTPKTRLPKWCCLLTTPYIISLTVKAIGLLLLNYIHPFSFDWLKPELMFVESYLGIEKWQFAFILAAMVLSIWKKQFLYLFLVVFAYQPTQVVDNIDPTTHKQKTVGSITSTTNSRDSIQIITTHITVQDKWNKTLHPEQFKNIFRHIDQAIADKKTLIILPESVFPTYINRSQALVDKLREKAKHISIVTGGLYWDGKTPRNSTYIFTDNTITVANKVVLVPFGESNPLPDFLSDWVNNVFYDGAVDYKASSAVTDYEIDGITYRNAICFEATSEKLYEGNPKHMIVLSNNGWFMPSIEPTLQKLLLQYYSKKYGTNIYHSVNMSNSYKIQNGKVIQ